MKHIFITSCFSPFANVSNTSSPEMTTNIVNLLHESEVNLLSISCSNSTNTCLISSSARTDLMMVKSSLSASVVAVQDISFVTFKRRSDIFSTEVENRWYVFRHPCLLLAYRARRSTKSLLISYLNKLSSRSNLNSWVRIFLGNRTFSHDFRCVLVWWRCLKCQLL